MLTICIGSLPLGHYIALPPRTEELHSPRPNFQGSPCIATVVSPHVGLVQLPDYHHTPALRKILIASLGQTLPRRHPKPYRLLLPLPVLARPSPARGNTETRYRIPARRTLHLRVIAKIPNQCELLIHSTVPLMLSQSESHSDPAFQKARQTYLHPIVHLFQYFVKSQSDQFRPPNKNCTQTRTRRASPPLLASEPPPAPPLPRTGEGVPAVPRRSPSN